MRQPTFPHPERREPRRINARGDAAAARCDRGLSLDVGTAALALVAIVLAVDVACELIKSILHALEFAWRL